jgi:Glutaredoxin-like domain (DUF836)
VTAPPPAPARLTLLTRRDCGLCEELRRELAALARAVTLPPLELLDVDSDPQLLRRYGLDVPVLLLDGTVVCRHRLEPFELLRRLRAPPTGQNPQKSL